MSLELIYKLHLNDFEHIEISEDGDQLQLIEISFHQDMSKHTITTREKKDSIRFDIDHAPNVIKAITEIAKFILSKSPPLKITHEYVDPNK